MCAWRPLDARVPSRRRLSRWRFTCRASLSATRSTECSRSAEHSARGASRPSGGGSPRRPCRWRSPGSSPPAARPRAGPARDLLADAGPEALLDVARRPSVTAVLRPLISISPPGTFPCPVCAPHATPPGPGAGTASDGAGERQRASRARCRRPQRRAQASSVGAGRVDVVHEHRARRAGPRATTAGGVRARARRARPDLRRPPGAARGRRRPAAPSARASARAARRPGSSRPRRRRARVRGHGTRCPASTPAAPGEAICRGHEGALRRARGLQRADESRADPCTRTAPMRARTRAPRPRHSSRTRRRPGTAPRSGGSAPPGGTPAAHRRRTDGAPESSGSRQATQSGGTTSDRSERASDQRDAPPWTAVTIQTRL